VTAGLDKMGDYPFVRMLGSGGMGDAYSGASTTADPVAVNRSEKFVAGVRN
jgi:hypothetical protein